MRTKQTNQTETEVLVPGNRRVTTGTPFKSRFNDPVYNVPFTEIWVPPSLPCTLKCGGDPEPLHLWWAELRARLWWLTASACRVPGAQCLPADVWPSAASPWGLKKKNLIRCEGIKWQMRTDRCMHFLFACLPGDRPLLLLLLRSSWYILLVEEGGVGGGRWERSKDRDSQLLQLLTG